MNRPARSAIVVAYSKSTSSNASLIPIVVHQQRNGVRPESKTTADSVNLRVQAHAMPAYSLHLKDVLNIWGVLGRDDPLAGGGTCGTRLVIPEPGWRLYWPARLRHFVGPDFKADERVRSERLGNGNVVGVAALGDQHRTDPRHVVAGVEGVPMATEIGLEPAGEITRGVGRRHADIAEIACAVSRGNIHAAAERDRKMRVVAADALALAEYFPR